MASCSGAAVTGAGLDGIMAGKVAVRPSKGSPMASDTSDVPQPCTALESSATLRRSSKCVSCSDLSLMQAQVQRQMRNFMQQTPSKSIARNVSTALLKRLLSELVKDSTEASTGFRPRFKPPCSRRKDMR